MYTWTVLCSNAVGAVGIVEGTKEDKVGWSGCLRHLQARGLKGIRLVLSDACLGRKESIGDFYPEAKW